MKDLCDDTDQEEDRMLWCWNSNKKFGHLQVDLLDKDRKFQEQWLNSVKIIEA